LRYWVNGRQAEKSFIDPLLTVVRICRGRF